MKKVVIVREGHWGYMKEEGYEKFIEMLKDIIGDTSFLGKKEVDVEVMALEEVKELRMVDILVFISRGMLNRAREIKKLHPHLKVVLFTGLIPEEEVILISKGWLLGVEEIRHIVLH